MSCNGWQKCRAARGKVVVDRTSAATCDLTGDEQTREAGRLYNAVNDCWYQHERVALLRWMQRGLCSRCRVFVFLPRRRRQCRRHEVGRHNPSKSRGGDYTGHVRTAVCEAWKKVCLQCVGDCSVISEGYIAERPLLAKKRRSLLESRGGRRIREQKERQGGARCCFQGEKGRAQRRVRVFWGSITGQGAELWTAQIIYKGMGCI